MSGGLPAPVLVDTSALVAICKTTYDELLYRSLRMETTNVCNEEVKRQKDPHDDLCHRQACRRYLELLRDEQNPEVRSVEPYKSYVDDQGEQTLIQVFRDYPSAVKYVLLFDFDAIERFDAVKKEIVGAALSTKISLPNHGFELLRQNDEMTDSEYCQATYQMGVEEDWMAKHALELDQVSPVDCPKFP